MPQWIDFKALRAELKIEQVLKGYNVELRIKGDRATAFCPLPGHKSRGEGKRRSPSFSVSLTKNVFQCFSCGAKGNVLDLAAYMEGLDPNIPAQLREAAMKLREKFGLSTSTKGNAAEPRNVTASAPPPKEPKTDAPAPTVSTGPVAPPVKTVVNAPLDFELKHLDPSHPYLSSRGFSPETVEHFGLGFCAKGLMADRIAIPLCDAAGKLVGYAGRIVDDAKINDENPKYRFPGARERNNTRYEFHKSEFLYNGHRIVAPVADLIVVEGFPSVWWLWQHRYTNVVALMGSSTSARQSELIEGLLAPEGRCWIMADGDDAGERCAKDLLPKITPRRFVRWVQLAGRQPTDLSGEHLTATLAPIPQDR